MSNYILEVSSLNRYVDSLSDAEIIKAVAEYKAKRYSELTQASHEMNSQLIEAWKRRHGKRPIPKVISDNALIFNVADENTCKFETLTL
tara:strand:+ start:42 stop:308 length:267 start_codon:yes stop_codon:yes gene_type:complete